MRRRDPQAATFPMTTTSVPLEDLPIASYQFVRGLDKNLDLALDQMASEALEIGADVIVGVKIEVVSGGSLSLAYGTAVTFDYEG